MWREQMVFLCCQFGIWTVLIDCTCSVHCRMSHNTAALCCLLSDLLVLAVTDWWTFWLGLHVLAKYYSCSCCRKTAHSLSHKHKLACMTHTETRRVLPHIFATCTLCPCRSKQWQWNIHITYIAPFCYKNACSTVQLTTNKHVTYFKSLQTIIWLWWNICNVICVCLVCFPAFKTKTIHFQNGNTTMSSFHLQKRYAVRTANRKAPIDMDE